MAAYLRNLFGSSQTATIPPHGKAKSRRRTESTPAPAPYYVFTNPSGNMPSTSTAGTSQSKVQAVNNYSTPPVMVSSPFSYPTYDSRLSHGGSRPSTVRAANNVPPTQMQGPYQPLTHIGSSEAYLRPVQSASRKVAT